jgi:hypothetical protein
MNMYNYFLKARVSLRTLSSSAINLFTQVAIVLELALVSSQLRPRLRGSALPHSCTTHARVTPSMPFPIRIRPHVHVHGYLLSFPNTLEPIHARGVGTTSTSKSFCTSVFGQQQCPQHQEAYLAVLLPTSTAPNEEARRGFEPSLQTRELLIV